jgi:hypothetical protein
MGPSGPWTALEYWSWIGTVAAAGLPPGELPLSRKTEQELSMLLQSGNRQFRCRCSGGPPQPTGRIGTQPRHGHRRRSGSVALVGGGGGGGAGEGGGLPVTTRDRNVPTTLLPVLIEHTGIPFVTTVGQTF